MKSPYEIIVAPLITEKMARSAEKTNVVSFKVRPDSNKVEIHRAVEEIFDVKVLKVRTMNRAGKLKRLGRFEGRRAAWKKAIVTLAEGQSIPDMQA